MTRTLGAVHGPRVLIAVTAAVATLSWLEHEAAAVPKPPPRVEITSDGLTARGELGTYCVQRGARVERAASDVDGVKESCVFADYPLEPRGHLPVAGGDRVTIRTKRAAEVIDVVLLRADGEDSNVVGEYRERKRADRRRRWRVRLPASLEDANVLSVFVTYSNGDSAEFWGGLEITGDVAVSDSTSN